METIRCDNQTNQRSDHGYETNEMKPIPKTSAESQQDLPICYRERERERGLYSIRLLLVGILKVGK